MRGLVVEKFLPEQDERGFYLRSWMFLGDKDRSHRLRSAAPVIKRTNVIDREEVPVPDEIRSWREKLHFDFGKFDYVIHRGRPILLDVNRTPGANPEVGSTAGQQSIIALAEGMNTFLAQA